MNGMIGAVLACLLAGASAAAAQDVSKCVMQTGMSIQKGWIAPEIFVMRDPASGKIEVIDGIVAAFNKDKPIEARLISEKDISRTFGWSLYLINGAGQRTKMQYQAALFLGTGELHVTARPIGFRDVFSATGKCKPYTG